MSLSRGRLTLSTRRERISIESAGGGSEEGAPHFPGYDRLVQRWFAGNHSDVGGSYPEPESRLSDIALRWMCEQATSIPDGLKTGPIFVNGVKVPNTGDTGPALNIFPLRTECSIARSPACAIRSTLTRKSCQNDVGCNATSPERTGRRRCATSPITRPSIPLSRPAPAFPR